MLQNTLKEMLKLYIITCKYIRKVLAHACHFSLTADTYYYEICKVEI